jgi:hypothetical protein
MAFCKITDGENPRAELPLFTARRCRHAQAWLHGWGTGARPIVPVLQIEIVAGYRWSLK